MGFVYTYIYTYIYIYIYIYTVYTISIVYVVLFSHPSGFNGPWFRCVPWADLPRRRFTNNGLTEQDRIEGFKQQRTSFIYVYIHIYIITIEVILMTITHI